MTRVYLDHNAASPMRDPVRAVLAEALARLGGNPSSPHAEGQAARRAVEEAREEIAALVGAAPGEVVFTSGGTESNNLAIRGAVAAGRDGVARPRVVTSAVEHPSVSEACAALEAGGAEIVTLPVDGEGRLDPAALEASLRRGRADLVTIQHANPETGVVQPISALAAIAAAAGARFHTDAVQSAGRIDVCAEAAGASLISVASHKVGGPAGVGALVVRDGTSLAPLLRGGAQESRRRPGTEPAALAVAFAAALRLREAERAETSRASSRLRSRLESGILGIAPAAQIHGAGAQRLPNTTFVFLPGAPGRRLVVRLDLAGFGVSTGSACTTGAARPSSILLAMGRSAEEAIDSLRISLGPETTPADVEAFLAALAAAAAAAGAGVALTGVLS